MFKIPEKQSQIKFPFYINGNNDICVKANKKFYRIKDNIESLSVKEENVFDLAKPMLIKGHYLSLGMKGNLKINEAIEKLDVLNNVHYQPTAKATFCNCYAAHLLGLIGIYLPRVWWKNESDLFKEGFNLFSNVLEYNANSLVNWLIANSENPLYNFKRVENYAAIENIGLIAVHNPNGSGHIAILYRNEKGILVCTQAGKKNTISDTTYNNWFTSKRFDKRIIVKIL
jgi:hypothetical protein